MSKITVFIVIIVILWIVLYIVYRNNNSSDNLWMNNNISIKNNQSEMSDIEKRLNNIVTDSSFKISNCSELIIQKYSKANDEKANKEFIITDTSIINEITNLLNELPENWEEFRSFIPTIPYTVLTFICSDNKNYKVEIYSDKLKTPGTTFYSSGTQSSEKKVVDLVNKLILEN